MTTVSHTPTRRRSALFRCSALVWAVVFLLSGMRDAVAQVDCSHHSAAVSAHGAGGAGHGHSLAAHAGEHASHGEHHPAHAEDRGDALPDPEAPGHPCTCVGPCQAAGAAALPPPDWSAVAPVAVHRTSPPVAGEGDLLPARAPFVLPYPNAPPLRG